MARVVQRRTPPYLLIVFVLLFVTAAVLAVMFMNKFTAAEEKLKSLEIRISRVISPEQERDPAVKEMINKRNMGTVVMQLRNQVGDLAGEITSGSPGGAYDDAKQRIASTNALVSGSATTHGLLTTIKDLHGQIGGKETEIARLQVEIATGKKDLEDAKAAREALEKAHADALAEKVSQFAALEGKFAEFEKQEDAKLVEAKQAFDAAVDNLKVQNKAVEDQLVVRTRERDVLAVELTNTRKKLSPDAIDPEKVVYRPDGKIRSVSTADGMAYLSIGSKERVTEGLRFTVYPYTGVTKDGKGKGVVEVLNVGPEVSEARIIEQSKDNPIVAGDVIANLVFDSLRNYKLMVEGNFDLNRTGQPNPAGNKAIKELVRKYGGSVTSEMGVDTSFLILGEAPAKPKKPEDTDPQDAWDLYQERLKDFNRYDEIKVLAKSLGIPVISSERFLDLIGYVPSKVKI